MPRPFDIDVGVAGTVTGLHYSPDARGRATIVLAHGAGAPQLHPFMTRVATGLAERGLDVVTFNFVYMERGRRAPDSKTRLELCYRAAIDTTRAVVPSARLKLVIGGKSMGGRIGSQVVAAHEHESDLGVAGLVFLGYPLHPPGRPERRRDAHLPSINVPMLFVQGSRDAFGTEAELRPVAEACHRAMLHVVKGGDHSLKVRGTDPSSQEQVLESVQDTIATWIAEEL